MNQVLKFFASFGFLIALLLLAIMSVRCGKSTDPAAATVSPTYSSLYTNVFGATCNACHVPSGSGYATGGHLDFTSPASGFTSLTTLKAGGVRSTSCSNVKYVDTSTANPGISYLECVLNSQYNGTNCGQTGCTPYANHLQDQNIGASAQSALVSWIQSGAPNN